MLVVVVVVAGAAVPAGAASPLAWSPPVDGPVVEQFDQPPARWMPGHLGVDYGVPPGTGVSAAGDGVVVFAGQVAGTHHVVVLHAGGLRTSYSFLASVAVRRGAQVRRGGLLGTSGGSGEGHGPGVLHLGLRSGERYLDPLLLFRPVDLAEVVHLAPATGGSAAAATVSEERRGILDGLAGLVAGVGGGVVSAVGDLVGAGQDAIDAVAVLVAGVGRSLEAVAGVLADGLTRIPEVVEMLQSLPALAVGPDLVLDVGGSLLAWARSRGECDHDAPPADGTGGSGHGVVVVAGINSSTADDGSTVGLPVDLLGYESGEVDYYSYADDGGPYARDDSYVPIEEAALRLAEQLREHEAEHPGEEVDLIAHSQGGVVVMAFLTLVYDPADPSYPPIGPVVTLSSPHEGAPLATAGVFIALSDAGRELLEHLPGGLVPPPSAESPRDLAEGSDLLGRIHDAALPGNVEITSIGAALDLVVPASSTGIEGADHVIVNPWSLSSHSAILTDPDALRAVLAAIEGRPPPCVSFADALVGAVAPAVITSVEHAAGLVVGGAGAAVDGVTAGAA